MNASSACGTSNQSQNNNHNKNNEKEPQGGFMAVLHRVAEQMWEPESPFDEKTRLFLFIQHKILRNKKLNIFISTELVCKSIGISPKNLSKIHKSLISSKMLKVSKKRYGLVEYQLHPERFGDDYIYIEKEKDPTKVIHARFGQQKEESADRRESRPIAEKEYASIAELLANSPLKNPSYKNPFKKNPSLKNEEKKEEVETNVSGGNRGRRPHYSSPEDEVNVKLLQRAYYDEEGDYPSMTFEQWRERRIS